MNKRVIHLGDIAKFNNNSLSTKEIEGLVEVNYLDTGSITKNKIEQIQNIKIEYEKLPSRARRKVKDKTIIYSTVRPNQEHYGFIESNNSDLIVSTGFSTIDITDKKIDPKYIYYFLTQKYITEYLHTIAQNSVATYPAINPSDIANLKLEVPDLINQEKISKILTNIDKKIELNNQINAELEAMAKTLYDYWFVQFDFPDENGKPYKSSGGKMVYNAKLKREIPEGWKDKTLSQIANITMGQSPKGDSYNDEGIGTIFYQGSTDFGWLFPTVRQYTTSPNRMAKQGDILLSVRAPVGDMNIANSECCIGRGLAALRSKTGSDGFLFYVMKYFKQIFDRRNSEGTTFGSITRNDLHSLPLAYPSKGILETFDNIVNKYNDMVFKRSLENQELEKLRDWLLPMLMNGQVSVTTN